MLKKDVTPNFCQSPEVLVHGWAALQPAPTLHIDVGCLDFAW